MAAAAVAVEMGPRNRRRLSTGAITVAVVGSIVAALLLFFNRSPDTSSTVLSGRTSPLGPSASAARLTFGMTQQQVRHFTGRPASTQGDCWLFRPTRAGMVGSISVQPSFATVPYDPTTTGDLKLCFLGGVFSYGYLHAFDKRNHKWIWGPWPLALSSSR